MSTMVMFTTAAVLAASAASSSNSESLPLQCTPLGDQLMYGSMGVVALGFVWFLCVMLYDMHKNDSNWHRIDWGVGGLLVALIVSLFVGLVGLFNC
ncbi:hypothetical protein KJF94_16140 [Pseudomonas hormoni]|uniref:TIGR03745 family integrating conjugative element membrane protein n=1 Tax=Pseudomonas hormoni TaxID=3093767 RepID=A0ABX8ET91_9PSED|nr:hypothetical protein [Pseudomonas hormoni]QVW21443.1 hypothetical protein KJF94_16140 [Pseudomonas hormoni]